ncbi:Calumeninlike [Caligus rogercresseyi]|uniref:Calumeninlike n=1 Tax=Caligus rogercresseyi TaxID=217165 RepID=A0A7T8KKZ4_CALRO|nr:Calumeninlike [Caligus rogercresseyi]
MFASSLIFIPESRKNTQARGKNIRKQQASSSEKNLKGRQPRTIQQKFLRCEVLHFPLFKMAQEIKDEEAMMSLNEQGVKVLHRSRGPSAFGTKTKLSVVCLTIVLLGIGGALFLGYPNIRSKNSELRIPTEFKEQPGSAEEYFLSEDALHPKELHMDSPEGHKIILNKISNIRSSFNSRFPRDQYGDPNYRYSLQELPDAFLRTLSYARQNSDERKFRISL